MESPRPAWVEYLPSMCKVPSLAPKKWEGELLEIPEGDRTARDPGTRHLTELRPPTKGWPI
jgi:hypothetical protein